MELHVRVMGGYGNRLPAIASVISSARYLEIPYKIYWNLDRIASYEHILPKSINCVDFKNNFNNSVLTETSDFINGKYKIIDGKVYLFICSPICNDYKYDLRCITDEIKNKIDYNSIICENTLGVHIRRTDHLAWLPIIKGEDPKPLEYFYNKIKKNRHLADSIFITSDSQDVVKSVCGMFENVIINNNIEYERSSTIHSNISALFDLFSLCECKYIIGTPHSTFSLFPYILNNNIKYIW